MRSQFNYLQKTGIEKEKLSRNKHKEDLASNILIDKKALVPSSNVSCVRKTAALFCIILCMFNRIFDVGSEPLEFLNLSSQAIVFSPASFSKGFSFSPALS